MDDASCFIHYKSIKFSDKLTLISETSFDSLSECKAIRQKLGGDNGHDEQCNNIPENWVEGKKMYYHRECYQKFVYARTLLKRKTSEETELENGKPKSRRRRSDALTTEEIQEGANARGLFPSICMFCKKKGIIQINRKREGLSKILTKSAEYTIKEAASVRNDKEMLMAVNDIDLIAKEFQKHRSCYKDYTRCVSKMELDSTSNDK